MSTATPSSASPTWPGPAADAWHAVNSGTPAPDAAHRLWPHYLRRVTDWLTSGQHATTRQRADALATARARLHTAVLTSQEPCR